jgi:outer membrane protein TolC
VNGICWRALGESNPACKIENQIRPAEQSRLQLSNGRKEFGVATALEVIQAQKDPVQARACYVRSMTAYAEGQYALAQAVGRISE